MKGGADWKGSEASVRRFPRYPVRGGPASEEERERWVGRDLKRGHKGRA